MFKIKTIESGESIIVGKEVLQAQLFSLKEIRQTGKVKGVVGGTLMAKEKVEINSAGSPVGVKTVIEVGKDFLVARRLEKAKRLHKEWDEYAQYLTYCEKN